MKITITLKESSRIDRIEELSKELYMIENRFRDVVAGLSADKVI